MGTREDLLQPFRLGYANEEKVTSVKVVHVVDSLGVYIPAFDYFAGYGFLEFGGVINLIKRANKIRFEINLTAAKQAQLKLDLKLLKLASSVTKN